MTCREGLDDIVHLPQMQEKSAVKISYDFFLMKHSICERVPEGEVSI